MSHKRVGVLAVVAVIGAACASVPNFSDFGTGNGSSRTFHLDDGVGRISFSAKDREPFLGCEFGISLASPTTDPLAPGRVIAKTEIRKVEPRGYISDVFLTPNLIDGDYTLEYLGDQPCDWTVEIYVGS